MRSSAFVGQCQSQTQTSSSSSSHPGVAPLYGERIAFVVLSAAQSLPLLFSSSSFLRFSPAPLPPLLPLFRRHSGELNGEDVREGYERTGALVSFFVYFFLFYFSMSEKSFCSQYDSPRCLCRRGFGYSHGLPRDPPPPLSHPLFLLLPLTLFLHLSRHR